MNKKLKFYIITIFFLLFSSQLVFATSIRFPTFLDECFKAGFIYNLTDLRQKDQQLFNKIYWSAENNSCCDYVKDKALCEKLIKEKKNSILLNKIVGYMVLMFITLLFIFSILFQFLGKKFIKSKKLYKTIKVISIIYIILFIVFWTLVFSSMLFIIP